MSVKKHIVCTGGAGYIGSHTVVALLATGNYSVTVIDNYCNTSEKVVTALEKVVGQKIDVASIDLRDYDALLAVFKKKQVDGVIHFAAKKNVGESVDMPLEYYDNNMKSLINIMKVMKETDCHVFVQSSSATVYQAAETNRPEDSPIGAVNPYGQTKVMAEQILKDVAHADPTLKISILRYFNPVGAHPSGELGECPDVPLNLLPVIQQTAVGMRECLYICGNDWPTADGTGVRDYIHVMDLAEGHVVALQKLSEQPQGCCMVHNLGTGRGTSVLELMHAFEDACGKKINHKFVARRQGDIARCCADPSKAETEWHWKPSRSIKDACESAWKFQSMHPQGW